MQSGSVALLKLTYKVTFCSQLTTAIAIKDNIISAGVPAHDSRALDHTISVNQSINANITPRSILHLEFPVALHSPPPGGRNEMQFEGGQRKKAGPWEREKINREWAGRRTW